MKIKSVVFLSILSLFFLNSCDSKKKTEENILENDKKVEEIKKERVFKKDFTLKTTNGNEIDLKIKENKIIIDKNDEKAEKKMILLSFFATWCSPCKAEIPNLIKLENNYKNDLEVIGVLLEDDKTNEDIQKFAKKYKIDYPVINSKENYELSDSLGGIRTIPTLFLIDKNSNIIQKYVGLVPEEMLEVDVKKVLSK